LKIAILAVGKTQRQVAAEGHLSENRLSEIVCGWKPPNVDEMAALARVLKQPVAVLFGDEAKGTCRDVAQTVGDRGVEC
jgi:transcriptional regulator with XRE-family HTH domain